MSAMRALKMMRWEESVVLQCYRQAKEKVLQEMSGVQNWDYVIVFHPEDSYFVTVSVLLQCHCHYKQKNNVYGPFISVRPFED